MIILIVLLDIQSWIDEYANFNTFLGLLIGIISIFLTIYLYKKQIKSSTKQKKETNFYPESVEPYVDISIKVDHVSRRMTGYGASEGEIIQAGRYKANYEVEAELRVTIQNESPDTIYQLEIGFTPNQYSQKYTLIDRRDNNHQPLEGNKHFEFVLRIVNYYYDVYAQDIDKDIHKIYKVGKDTSLLCGSKINIIYLDSKHKKHSKTKIIA